MAPQGISSLAQLGARIADAREAVGLTQGTLGEAVGLERTMIAKIESGTRKVSATELMAIAQRLDRPLDWFVVESPPAVVSRRRSALATYDAIDGALERLARDVELLFERNFLRTEPRPTFSTPVDIDQAIALAASVRALLGRPAGPLEDLQSASETLGLLAFSISLGRQGGNAAYVEVGPAGIALINGSVDDGRRRFSLAHELGHHVTGDAYEGTDSGAETERLLDAFAAHFLMPGPPIASMWPDLQRERGTRLAALAVAVRYRVSWSAAISQLRNLELISHSLRDDLAAQEPTRGDHVELGEDWAPELVAPSVPRSYGRQVVEAYREGRLTESKALELLHGTLGKGELPPHRPDAEAELLEMFRPRR
jgi:Zn-dependent peptidase ImmA (M78 family)/DNA-binding XRE family transcriptional regulator